MKGLTGAILIAVLVFAGPAFAQFYKYVNKQGEVRFTDDINQVPREQRAAAQSYPGSQTPDKAATQESAAVKEEKPADHEPAVASAAADGKDEDPIAGKRARLDAQKKEVEAEYQALVKEKDRLSKEKGEKKTRDEINAYNKEVEAYNHQAESFEKKNEDLRKLVDNYNALVNEANAKTAAASKNQ
jgi:hypothetical protein